ncbi:MAG: hypothetical protein AUG51_13010 [Acidobacteria bacterium 13_1_20CM_3_53_8]|nr:MAG: hypothetical protein AUG51_13010 [Acidobacteria bacterium 13_1_20CM_3_53_8]
MQKCSICRKETKTWAWQPDLESFYLPGNHIRGFAAIAVGDQCKGKIDNKEVVNFTHKKQRFQSNGNGWELI